MSEDYQRLLQQVAELRRMVANTHQHGTVKEVKGDKLRMIIGKDKNGKEVLSPWLNTATMRGGAREMRFFKPGQTLALICPGGDIRQGMITPFAPNKDFQRPEHADSSGKDEESYQLDDYRQKQTKDGVDMWLQPDEKQQQSGGQQQQKKGHVGGGKAKMKSRMNASGGITHRVGTEMRMAAHQKGVKMRSKSDWVVVKDGQIIMSRPPIIDRDPVPNDDA